MSPTAQTVTALVIVGLAVLWLVWRAVAKRKHPGCASDCGCPASEVKASAARLKRP